MDFPAVTPDLAAIVAPWAAMSSNSYSIEPGKPFDVACRGWTRIDRDGNPSAAPAKVSKITGLVVDLYRDANGRVIVVFRGTDSLRDWILANAAIPFSTQYYSANKFYRSLRDRFGSQIGLVTGHSLGGGIALGISLRYGVDAVVFNSSPRVFDGLGDRHLPAKRTAVYQKGDPLSKTWRVSTKARSLIRASEVSVFEADFANARAHPHSIERLAGNLIALGAQQDPTLACLTRP
jgi:pimeloyl-ACP methyl ester carboxylesterase